MQIIDVGDLQRFANICTGRKVGNRNVTTVMSISQDIILLGTKFIIEERNAYICDTIFALINAWNV